MLLRLLNHQHSMAIFSMIFFSERIEIFSQLEMCIEFISSARRVTLNMNRVGQWPSDERIHNEHFIYHQIKVHLLVCISITMPGVVYLQNKLWHNLCFGLEFARRHVRPHKTRSSFFRSKSHQNSWNNEQNRNNQKTIQKLPKDFGCYFLVPFLIFTDSVCMYADFSNRSFGLTDILVRQPTTKAFTINVWMSVQQQKIDPIFSESYVLKRVRENYASAAAAAATAKWRERVKKRHKHQHFSILS